MLQNNKTQSSCIAVNMNPICREKKVLEHNAKNYAGLGVYFVYRVVDWGFFESDESFAKYAYQI